MSPHWLSEKLRRHPERSPRAALDRTADTESTESTLNEVDHRRTWKKIDFRILPLVSLLYLLSFLDRTNIGNAQVAGIAQDLHLTPLQFSTATAIFFVTYSAFEVPSNILLKLVRPKRWIPAIMLVWGIVQTLTCLVNNYKGLIAGRVFLGVAEAGLAPGVLYYLSFWYPRHKRAFRFSLFFSAASLAGAFGGIFAFSIEKLDGRAGLYGWQWIFLIEGLLTTVVAVGAYFYMTDTPDLARFLSEEEREYVISSLKEPSNEDKSLGKLHFAKEALTDPKAWIQGIMLLTALPAVYAAALFLPTIVNSLGFTAASAQLLSVPPFAVASVYTVAVGYWSDRVNSRGPIAAFNVCLQLIGYVLAYTSNGGAGQGYAGVVIAAMGAYANLAINNAWNAGNVAGDAKRGVVIAMTIGLGNCGGVITPFAYDDPPTYRQGHAAVIACLCISMACTVTLMLWFHHLNKRKAERCKREGITQDMVDLYRHEGDASPLFRYVI